jgi:hypothetical protein
MKYGTFPPGSPFRLFSPLARKMSTCRLLTAHACSARRASRFPQQYRQALKEDQQREEEDDGHSLSLKLPFSARLRPPS